MTQPVSENSTAVIVLHDQNGSSRFREETCRQYRSEGCDVFCFTCADEPVKPPAPLPGDSGGLEEGLPLSAYDALIGQITALKQRYRQVLLIGFGTGADFAWQCSLSPLCGGVLACCPSRLQERLEIVPACPVFLLLAANGPFDAPALSAECRKKEGVRCEVWDTSPGFWDPDSETFSHNQAQRLHLCRRSFWNSHLAVK